MVEPRYELLKTAVLALATEMEEMHGRYVQLNRHDPYLAQSYRIAADQLRRLVTAVEQQEMPAETAVVAATAEALARQAHLKAMIAAGEIES